MNDDLLTLYYYDDGLTDRERSEIETALRTDAGLAARYAALAEQLELLGETHVQPAPTHMVQRWHDSIERAAQREAVQPDVSGKSFSLLSFAWGAAVTAALAVGIGIGFWFAGSETTPPIAPIAYTDDTVDEPDNAGGAFTRGLKVHLRDTGKRIDSLPVDDSADRILLIMQIIQQNRMFERAAEQNDSENLARVLRAFEPILLRLAADDIAPEDAAELREQLAFELKVMLTILERDASKETQST